MKSKKHKRPAKKESRIPVIRSPRIRAGLTRIKVVGVGGGGGNAVSRMMEGDRMKGVEFIAVNTDAQDLDHTVAHRKIYIGKALTRGLGAGMNPDIGKQAAEENRSEVGEAIDGSDVVFITAGMGGGTGTGASPIIAEVSREKGILTVGIVTKPFLFEGAQRSTIAQDGLARLKEKVDALVVIPNDRIFGLIDKDTPMYRAFAFIDDVLKNSVKAIAELMNIPGLINIDFADIKTILKDAGPTMIGIGVASGAERSMKAVQGAVNSPLLEISIDGAKGVLFSVAGGKDLKMSEVNDIAKAVSANLDSNARVIFGAYHDKWLKDKAVKVTVIATGFNGIFNGARLGAPSLFVPDVATAKKDIFADITGKNGEKVSVSKGEEAHVRLVSVREPEAPDNDFWAKPAFLRKKKR